MDYREHHRTLMAAAIDAISEDLLHNIVARLPATSFASAACVNRSFNLVCNRFLCRPKLSSACSFNPSLQVAVEEVVNKLLSQPIRPHFAIASVIGHYYEDGLGDAHRLALIMNKITRALGTHVPVITDRPSGVIGTDAFSDDFQEDESDAIMLLVGYLPGLKVTTIPLLKQIQEPETVMIDEFVTDIREFSTSVSGCNSPAAIIMLSNYYERIKDVTEKLDYAMSPKTVIVGNTSCRFRFTNDGRFGSSAAVALVFAVDKNKPPGIGETLFHVELSKGSSPVGPTYKETFVRRAQLSNSSVKSARREGSVENMDSETILNQVNDKDLVLFLAFQGVCGNHQWYLCGRDLKTGDMYCIHHPHFRYPNSTTLSSAAAVSSYLRTCSQRSINTTGTDKLEVFGGLIFTCPDFYSQRNYFRGATLGETFCSSVIGRRVLNPLVNESQEQKAVPCCERIYNSLYLIMSYIPLD